MSLEALYWDDTGNSWATCTLITQQQDTFRQETTPHLSLSRDRKETWQSVGYKATITKNTRDWQDKGKGIQYSPSRMYGEKFERYCEAGNSLVVPGERLTVHIANYR